jgi:hypothetical protein
MPLSLLSGSAPDGKKLPLELEKTCKNRSFAENRQLISKLFSPLDLALDAILSYHCDLASAPSAFGILRQVVDEA